MATPGLSPMKLVKILIFGLFAIPPASSAQTTPVSPLAPPNKPSTSESSSAKQNATVSPAQRRIASAKLQTQKHPERFQNYNDLALAFVARARETADPTYYKNAEQVIQAGIKLSPNEFQLLKTQAIIMLGQHEYSQAREKAQALNRRTPDDVAVYGYLAAANLELGNYEEAEDAAQWMLNLLPNNIPGLLAGAELRDVFGDPDGALQFLSQAYSETSPDETEELTWIANRIASVQIRSGKIDAAEQVLERAQKLILNYPHSLENLATVRLAQDRFADAVELFRERRKQFANPTTSYALAHALDRAGRTDEAKIVYVDFERAAISQMNAADNANRELIFYYVDSAGNAAKALEIARHEVSLRHDVFTLDAYAWALYANGYYDKARREIDKAIAVGIRDAQIFFHAGEIAAKLNNLEAAARYFDESLATNSHSECASQARISLRVLSAQTVQGQKLSAASSTSQDSGLLPETPPSAITPDAREADPVDTAEQPALYNGSGTSHVAFQPVPAMLLVPRPTETDRAIKSMQARVARNPSQASAYARLGAAFFQKARETGDVSNFQLAEQALNKSLELNSGDMSAAAATLSMAEVCMGEHRFADALTYAQKALSYGSGDLSPFAVEGDAYTDIGEYEKAAAAYSKLQPTGIAVKSSASYAGASRLSFLKFLSGDTQGAVHLMQAAVSAGSEAQLPSENLAWLYFELGEYYFQAGDAAAADNSYLTALTIHPGDYRALAGLGRVRANEGKFADAIELYRKAVAVVPMPSFIAELGDIYVKTGQTAEATKQFKLVEYIGLLGNINKVLHNRDLALFYADHDINLVKSLELARKEFEVRHDIYTWDVLGWTLYKNRNLQEAAKAMTNALRLHTKDAMLLFHAGMIYQTLGQTSEARQYFSQALAINPKFHVIYSELARQQLAGLSSEVSKASSGNTSDAP